MRHCPCKGDAHPVTTVVADFFCIMSYYSPGWLISFLLVYFSPCLLACTIQATNTINMHPNTCAKGPKSIRTLDQTFPFGPFFERSSYRIRHALRMPPFSPSTDTEVDPEAFMQALQVFKFVNGMARLPYLSADQMLEQIPKYVVWEIEAGSAIEATRQALLVGAIKGLAALNGFSPEYPDRIEALSCLASMVADWVEKILGERPRNVRVLQLGRVVAQGKFFKSWGRSKLGEPFPHLPHIYEAFRGKYGMARRSSKDAAVDPEVLLQLVHSTEFIRGRKETCIPTLKEIYNLIFIVVQKARELNRDWLNLNYGTRSGLEVAIWSVLLDKPYREITHGEQVHFMLNKQYTLDKLGSLKQSLQAKLLKSAASGVIGAAWAGMVPAMWSSCI